MLPAALPQPVEHILQLLWSAAQADPATDCGSSGKTREDEPNSQSPVLNLTMLLSPRHYHLSTRPSCCRNEGSGQLRALSQHHNSQKSQQTCPTSVGGWLGWRQGLTCVNGRASVSRKPSQPLHNSHREGNCRKSALFMAPQRFKEESKGLFFHHNCCWCKQKLQMLRLSEGSDPGAKCNEYYGLFASPLLPGWFCSPELHCRAVPSHSGTSPFLWLETPQTLTLSHCTTPGSSRNYPSWHCKKNLPSIISRGTATFVSTPLAHKEQVMSLWHVRGLFWGWSSSTEIFPLKWVWQGN